MTTPETKVEAPAVDAEQKQEQQQQAPTAGGADAKQEQPQNLGKKSKKKSALEGAIDVDPVQGCRDFPPEEMRVRNFLFGAFRNTAKSFGFEEYDAPMLESVELYVRKQGEEITDQMFDFTTKGGHHVALRPEMTPTLARLLIAKGKALALPVKWYSIPQCWRYETIQKGRKREHYQWNMDIVGVKNTTAEAELVCAQCDALEQLGLTAQDVGIRINSRKILQSVVMEAGVPENKFQKVCIVVDKLDKIGREAVEADLAKEGLSADVVDVVTSTLALKSLEEIEKKIGAEHEAVKELRLFFDTVEAYGYGEWVNFDASVVRGLAYYTGIVFEGFDRKGQFRAICGGGRYDGLMTKFGSPRPVPCCGFGFGDCVIIEMLMEKYKCKKDKKGDRDPADLVSKIPALARVMDYVVIPFNGTMRANATGILRKLRNQGYSCDIVLGDKKIVDAFKQADMVNAKYAVLVAPDEWEQGKVTLKNLRKEGQGKESEDKGQAVTIEELLAGGEPKH